MKCHSERHHGQFCLEYHILAQVTQRYLEHLVSQRRFDEAAQVCSRLLKVSKTALLSNAIVLLLCNSAATARSWLAEQHVRGCLRLSCPNFKRSGLVAGQCSWVGAVGVCVCAAAAAAGAGALHPDKGAAAATDGVRDGAALLPALPRGPPSAAGGSAQVAP